MPKQRGRSTKTYKQLCGLSPASPSYEDAQVVTDPTRSTDEKRARQIARQLWNGWTSVNREGPEVLRDESPQHGMCPAPGVFCFRRGLRGWRCKFFGRVAVS